MIGLVGGIGAGKSLVAHRFATLGGFVIDADKVGHALLDQRPVRERVVGRFGPIVLDASCAEGESERIDRRVLGGVVFADPVARLDLEAILHPRMRQTFEKAIDRTVRRGEARAVVLDAAVLFEAGWETLCDKVIWVDAPRPLRLERLKADRGWDEATLDAREKAQRPMAEKRTRCDLVIVNAGDLDALHAEVDRVWAEALTAPKIRPERRSRAEGTEPLAPSRRGPASGPPPGRDRGSRGH